MFENPKMEMVEFETESIMTASECPDDTNTSSLEWGYPEIP